MSKTIYVSKGASRYIGGTVTEKTGKDITADVFVVALGVYDIPPAKASGVAPTANDPGATTASRVIKKLVTNADTPVEAAWLWCWVTDNPEIEPIRLDGPINIR